MSRASHFIGIPLQSKELQSSLNELISRIPSSITAPKVICRNGQSHKTLLTLACFKKEYLDQAIDIFEQSKLDLASIANNYKPTITLMGLYTFPNMPLDHDRFRVLYSPADEKNLEVLNLFRESLISAFEETKIVQNAKTSYSPHCTILNSRYGPKNQFFSKKELFPALEHDYPVYMTSKKFLVDFPISKLSLYRMGAVGEGEKRHYKVVHTISLTEDSTE